MAPSASNVSDRITVIAARLAELGKRPISPKTHPELTRLHEELDALVNNFIMCDRCGNLFPQIAHLTIDGRTANLCASCGITSLQKWAIEVPSRDMSSPAPVLVDEPSVPLHQQPAAQEPEAQSEGQPQTKASPPQTRPLATRSHSASAGRVRARRPEDKAGADRQAVGPGNAEREADEVVTRGTPGTMLDESTEPRAAPKASPSPRRVAKRARNDALLFKASVSDVAKFLRRPSQEVRQIGKLIEEISPPMDTEKTTRYVMAELRNAKSKIPAEVVSGVVATLKQGIPGAGKGDGGG